MNRRPVKLVLVYIWSNTKDVNLVWYQFVCIFQSYYYYYYDNIDEVWILICRWEVIGDEEGIQYGPFPVPKKGLPIRVTPI